MFAAFLASLGAEAVSALIKEGMQWLKEKQAKGEIEDMVKLKIANDMLEVGNRALEVRSYLLEHPDAIDSGVLLDDKSIPAPGQGQDPTS